MKLAILIASLVLAAACARGDDPHRLRITDTNAATWWKDIEHQKGLSQEDVALIQSAMMRYVEAGGNIDRFGVGKTVGEIINTERAQPRMPTHTAEEIATAEKIEREQAEYPAKIELRNLSAHRSTSVDGDPFAVIDGEIKNRGERTLRLVKLTIYFLDSAGKRVHEYDTYPVLVDGPL